MSDRRTVLMTAGAVAAIAAAAPVAAQSTAVGGTIIFEGGAVLPEGHLEIDLEDLAVQDRVRRRAARTRIGSDGRSRSIPFSVMSPASATVSPMLRIVVRLERPDGWLIARGSARYEAGSPVQVTLNAVLY